MVDSTPVPETSLRVSSADRLRLIQTLNALPSAPFDELIVAIQLPQSNNLGYSAPRSSRSKALLSWVENPFGPGLRRLELLLGKIITQKSKTSQEYLSFALRGEINSKTQLEVGTIARLLQKKTGDISINVAFCKEETIKIVLTGSPEGLQKLQEIFYSGELEAIGSNAVKAVYYADITTTGARKMRLVQTLKLASKSTTRDIDIARDIAIAIAHDIDSYSHINSYRDIATAIAHNRDRSLNITRILSRAHNNSHLKQVRNLTRILDRDLTRALDINRDHGRDRNSYRALDLARDLARNLIHDHNSNQQLDLKQADLTNTNLQDIDLRQTNLTEADFTGADLTGAILTGAILTGAVLTEANITRTVFGRNEGLTDTDKLNLKSRGAIFLD